MDISEQQQLQREILEVPVSEQRRIGQELHDGLGQQLTGLGMLATSLLNKASKAEHDLADKLAHGLNDAIAQVRALSRGLMPFEIDAAGLVVALQNLVDDIHGHTSISISFQLNEPVHVSDNNAAVHIYRVAQEAINNALKHAGAETIEVTFGIDGTRGLLSVRDDGQGLEQNPDRSAGLGMRIMKHRCGLIDGEFRIESTLGEGTEVKCYFPVDRPVQERP